MSRTADRSSEPRTERFDPVAIQRRWEARWDHERPFPAVDVEHVDPRAVFYNLVEFPYPSAEGLHVGHVYTYCGADVLGRYLRMRGRKVFQPMGFDSFGIHTENYALTIREHPKTVTDRTVANYRRQLRRIGAAWDWDHEVITSDPSYYRWTQWVFLQLFRAGLAVQKEAPVVWCPSCLTVLANEQLEGDRCERCGSEVTQRVMRQWFLRITSYADALVDRLDGLDWPELAKRGQRAWIGRSHGVDVDFAVEGSDVVLTAFTTSADTLFGVTFVAVAPGHPALSRLGVDQDGAVPRFIGRYAVSPADGSRVPIWIAEHVVAGYGTGVVMGVPAHDERDRAFAAAMGLPSVDVVVPSGEGEVLAASGAFTGMPADEAKGAIAAWLEERGSGRPAVRYRLHDWLISRQRYWGPPIPIIHCPDCGVVPVPEDQLPVLLPDIASPDAVRPTGAGSPLAAVESFVRTTCPRCGGPAERETDVADTFFDSAWYFLRYPSSDLDDRAWDPGRTERVLPVDQYAGGREHVARHHLYARFTTAALHDMGLVPFAEPFARLRLHGLLNKDGAKMSKSRGNVVDPDAYVDRVGADALRTYLLFCGDWEAGGDFSDRGLQGILRFLRRAWSVFTAPAPDGPGGVDVAPLWRCVDTVAHDIERLKFNTAISALMETLRWLRCERSAMSPDEWSDAARTFVLCLAPFAPYVAEELWARLGGPYSAHAQRWPESDVEVTAPDVVTVVVQVDGRVRDRIDVRPGTSQDEVVAASLSREAVRRHLPDGAASRVVFVPDRLVNLVP